MVRLYHITIYRATPVLLPPQYKQEYKMIDIKNFKEKVLAGTASIVRLQADFPEAAQYAVYQKKFDENGMVLPDEVTAIRKMDVYEFPPS